MLRKVYCGACIIVLANEFSNEARNSIGLISVLHVRHGRYQGPIAA